MHPNTLARTARYCRHVPAPAPTLSGGLNSARRELRAGVSAQPKAFIAVADPVRPSVRTESDSHRRRHLNRHRHLHRHRHRHRHSRHIHCAFSLVRSLRPLTAASPSVADLKYRRPATGHSGVIPAPPHPTAGCLAASAAPGSGSKDYVLTPMLPINSSSSRALPTPLARPLTMLRPNEAPHVIWAAHPVLAAAVIDSAFVDAWFAEVRRLVAFPPRQLALEPPLGEAAPPATILDPEGTLGAHHTPSCVAHDNLAATLAFNRLRS